MKKLIFAILTMMICVFLLAGCDDALSNNDALESTDVSSDAEVKFTDNTENYEEESDVESTQTTEESFETTEENLNTTEESFETTEENLNTTEESFETTEVYENNWEEMKYANGYGYTVSFVGWANDSDREELYQGQTGRYPIFKIDTVEELEQFKSKCSNIFDFSQGYDEALSFEDTMEKTKWDTEAFYKEHSLLVICVKSGSGSFRYGVKEIVTDDDSMSIDVDIVNNPIDATDDMVGWLVLIEITDEQAQKYTTIDVN